MRSFRIFPRRRVEISWQEVCAVSAHLFLPHISRDRLISDFEQEFANFIGVKHAIAIPKARIGLSLVLDNLGFEENDEVLISSYNYHVIPALLAAKKLRPVFVDVDSKTWNINPSLIEQKITPRTKCIIATHLYGHCCDMNKLLPICERYNLFLIEDVAHACGGEYNGQKLGSFGDAACFSFGTGKALVAFGGGMLTTNNDRIFRKVKDQLNDLNFPKNCINYKDLAKSILETVLTKKIIFPFVVYPAIALANYINSEFVDTLIEDKYVLEDGKANKRSSAFTWFQASLGTVQLKRNEELNKKRIYFAVTLNGLLKDVEQIKLPHISGGREHIGLYYCIIAKQSAELRKYLFSRGVDTKRGSMKACSSLGIFANADPCPIAENVASDVIELPCYPSLNLKDIYYQANLIRKFYGKPPKSPDPVTSEHG